MSDDSHPVTNRPPPNASPDREDEITLHETFKSISSHPPQSTPNYFYAVVIEVYHNDEKHPYITNVAELYTNIEQANASARQCSLFGQSRGQFVPNRLQIIEGEEKTAKFGDNFNWKGYKRCEIKTNASFDLLGCLTYTTRLQYELEPRERGHHEKKRAALRTIVATVKRLTLCDTLKTITPEIAANRSSFMPPDWKPALKRKISCSETKVDTSVFAASSSATAPPPKRICEAPTTGNSAPDEAYETPTAQAGPEQRYETAVVSREDRPPSLPAKPSFVNSFKPAEGPSHPPMHASTTNPHPIPHTPNPNLNTPTKFDLKLESLSPTLPSRPSSSSSSVAMSTGSPTPTPTPRPSTALTQRPDFRHLSAALTTYKHDARLSLTHSLHTLLRDLESHDAMLHDELSYRESEYRERTHALEVRERELAEEQQQVREMKREVEDVMVKMEEMRRETEEMLEERKREVEERRLKVEEKERGARERERRFREEVDEMIVNIVKLRPEPV